ncbi:hypothetical protein JCM1840_007048 [Sporobolomyces johnsonii]
MADPGPSVPPPPPPRPATPGVGPTPETTRAASLSARIGRSRPFRFAGAAWRWKGVILTGTALTYALVSWEVEKARARKRDTIHDKTYLYWKIYDGGIVEAKSYGSNLNYLLTSSQGGSPEEPPRIMTLFDVVRTIKFIEGDDRIRGIIADFSSTSVPSVPSYNLGLAQLEEIQDAMLELRRVKQEKFGAGGEDGWRTVAWTDTFTGQGQFLLASTFDEVYSQPTGEVPLVGMGSTTPFFGRLAKWLGIDIHAEARNEYKSFVQPYIDEKLTDPQRENHHQLITDLNDNLLTYLARNRFPHLAGAAGLEHVKALSQVGPFTADQAVQNGLLTGTCYRQDIIDSVLDPEFGGKDERRLMGFYHYAKLMEKAVEKYLNDAIEVGVVYLMGTIGDPGEFGTAAVVRGLKEAGEDDTIGAVVLRIDSGGGGVVDSDTIWGAVRDLRERKGKTVVASFGNASASGGYLVSTHTDAILAAPSTVTGSIGVASLRPTFLQSFFDRFHITLESFFTGSRAQDPTHPLSPAELERHAHAVDTMYDDFKRRVCEGRGIDPSVIEGIAGGRVMTGLRAFELNAPEELIRQIKGLEVEASTAEGEKQEGGEEKAKVVEVAAKDAPASSPLEKTEGGTADESTLTASTPVVTPDSKAVVQLAEDQETSPFAPTEPSTDTSPSPAPTTAPSTTQTDPTVPSSPELNAEQALATSTPEEQSTPTASSSSKAVGANNGAAGLYDYTPGPYGRGLIDGLGGLRDAAIYACQLFIANGVAGYKETHPGVTDSEAIAALLPDAKFVPGGDEGELALQVDVRLKRFPVHKSFWQSVAEASRRGDSMSDSLSIAALPSLSALQAALSRWFFTAMAERVAAEFVDGEVAGLGLNGGPRTPGLGSRGGVGGKGWWSERVRWEWDGARGWTTR